MNENNVTCEIHTDEKVFVHWGRYYCYRCRKWYEVKD